MLGRKCRICGNKLEKDYRFCPYCGTDFKKEKEERAFGMLGRGDESFFNEMKMPFGFNRLFSSLLKEVDKQFKELDKQIPADKKSVKIKPTSGISISISAIDGQNPQIRINGFLPEFNKEQKFEEKIKPLKITPEQEKKLSSLPRKEAETRVRRLSNKLVYEIELPGVKNMRDVSINRLENSIEIKAFSDKEVYFKLLPVSLPVLNHKLEEGKLILELMAR